MKGVIATKFLEEKLKLKRLRTDLSWNYVLLHKTCRQGSLELSISWRMKKSVISQKDCFDSDAILS